MTHRVASAYGLSPMTVEAWPFALVLFWYFQITEHERITLWVERFADLTRAGHQARAFHEPAKLQKVQTELQEEAGMVPGLDESVANAQRMLERVAAFDATPEEVKE